MQLDEQTCRSALEIRERESEANALDGLRQISIDPFLTFDCLAPQVNKHLRLGDLGPEKVI